MQAESITKYLDKLERKIVKTNSIIEETKSLLSTLKDIEEHASKLEELVSKDEKIKDLLKEELKNKELQAKIKILEKRLLELRSFLREKEEPTLKLDVLLESLRASAKYKFKNNEQLEEFLIKCFKELKEKQISFRPRILGIMDIENLKKFGKYKDSWIYIPIKKFPKFLQQLRKEKQREFIYCGKKIKIIQKENLLDIKANTDTIQFLDTIAKINNAKIIA